MQKDCLIQIFSFLSPKDIISCSSINKLWYLSSSDNYLWFLKCNEQIKNIKYKNQNLENLIYNYEINWKLLYLGMFHHRYESFTMNQCKDVNHFMSTMANNEGIGFIFATIVLYVPFMMIIIPLALPFEIYNYIKHKRNKLKACNCDSCYYKQLYSAIKLLKYYKQ